MLDQTLITDTFRYAHLLTLIGAMGTAIYADFTTLRSIRKPISHSFLETVQLQHRAVLCMFAAVWLTGLALVWWRTGFDLAQFSPKLWTKIIVVSTLTLNAGLISAIALPMLRRSIGLSLMDFTLPRKLLLATIGSVSAASWLFALALGSSKTLATAGWDTLTPTAFVLYGSCLGGTSLLAVVSHAQRMNGAKNLNTFSNLPPRTA